MLTRRELMRNGALGLGGVLLAPRLDTRMAPPPSGGSTLSKFTEPLPVPPVIDLTGGTPSPYRLEMGSRQHVFHRALPATDTFGYGPATYLGPTLETKRGVPVDIEALHALGAHPLAASIDLGVHGAEEEDRVNPRATIHLHGGNVEAVSDGHPEKTIRNGQTYAYHYASCQEAANIWYHDHALGITRLNVIAGLAGIYLIRDDLDTGRPGGPLNLPTGTYEIPLVIQDRSFRSDGTFAYPTSWAPMVFGDVVVVNGKAWPNLVVDRGWYRFRIYNGSNARIYRLGLSNGQPLYQIGGDGGLLDAPLPLTAITLAPGERADVLVDFSRLSSRASLRLVNTATTGCGCGGGGGGIGGGGGGGMGGGGGGGMGGGGGGMMAPALPDLMQFTASSRRGHSLRLPGSLRTPIVRLPAPMVTRNVSLVQVLDQMSMLMMPLQDNLTWHHAHMSGRMAMPMVDSLEQWNIINTTHDTHPIHLHLVMFQVLGRQPFRAGMYLMDNYPNLSDPENVGMGDPWPVPSADAYVSGPLQPPDPNEMGWKDTVRASPHDITRIVVPFGGMAASDLPFSGQFSGDYVWHCHILEHEDHDMMLPMMVMPMDSMPMT